jgi:ABC-2 type transport system permease protein
VNAVRLIAGREFRAYVATASFWIAFALGPLLAAGALAAAGGGAAAPPALTLARARDGALEARFSPGFPASEAARGEIVRLIAAESRRPLRLAPPAPPADRGAIGRFVLTLVLWITLTGSLGMLLQSVVRERASRALESLLASTRPAEIVAGKLLGIGAVSGLVTASWLGAGAIAAAAGRPGAALPLLAAFSEPAALAGAVALYVLAFAFYGSVTVALGARARDSADAQNLARPMFAVLLVVFFVAMASAGGARGFDGLVFLPPFTPFLLIMRPASGWAEAAAIAILAAATPVAAWLAARSIGLDTFVTPRRHGRLNEKA